MPDVIWAGFRRNFTSMSGDKPAIVLSYPPRLPPSLLRQIVATERTFRDALLGDRQEATLSAAVAIS